MKTVRCRNRYKGMKNGRCGHIEVILTDLQIDMLKVDPEKGPIVRCPACPPEQRWAQISMDKDGKLIYTVLEKPPENLPEELEYDEEIVCEQVG